MNLPKISIITPVWNGLPFLRECISSITSQDFMDWELLISDDGSSDESIKYLNTLTDGRIKIYVQEKNLGIFGNLNFLFAKATAPISQILCQDDYFIAKNSLSKIVSYWNNASSTIGFARFNHLEFSDCYTVNWEKEVVPAIITPDESDLWFFVFGNIPGNLSNVSLRTKVVSEMGYFNNNIPFAGDFEFWSRTARRYSMGVQKDYVVFVRRHDKVASIFLGLKGELYMQHKPIYEKLIDRLSIYYDREKMVSYYNFDICSFHYRTALKAALNGRFAYMFKFITTKSSIDWPKWKQLIACFPFAVLNGKQKYTVKMAQRLLEMKRYESQNRFD